MEGSQESPGRDKVALAYEAAVSVVTNVGNEVVFEFFLFETTELRKEGAAIVDVLVHDDILISRLPQTLVAVKPALH